MIRVRALVLAAWLPVLGCDGQQPGLAHGATPREASPSRAGCAHPLLPPADRWIHYDVSVSGRRGTHRLRREPERAPGVTVWTLSTTSAGSEPVTRELELRCDDERGLEDPWSTIEWMTAWLPSADAQHERGRWPRALEEGAAWQESLRVPLADRQLDMRREYEIEGAEEIVVGGTRIAAIRVRVADEVSGTDALDRSSGHVWVAPGVGLVRSDSGVGDARAVLEIRESDVRALAGSGD